MTLPRFETRGVFDRPAQFAAPLPPVLLEALGPKAAEHKELAGRYEAQAAKVRELTAELEKAQRGDAARERSALAAGKEPSSASRAEKVSGQLVTASRQLGVLGDLLRESAMGLLAASVEHVVEAEAQADRASAEAIAEALSLSEAAQQALDRAGERALQAGWLAELRLYGNVSPWTGGGRAQPCPRAAGLLAALPQAFAEDRAAHEKRIAEADRERELESRNLPPGQEVWRIGGPDAVVDEQGELVEAEEVER